MPDDYASQLDMKTVQSLSITLFDFLLVFWQNDNRANVCVDGLSVAIQFENQHFRINGQAIEYQDSKSLLITVTDLTKLEEMEEEAAEAKHRTLLIASASHELRTPLNGVISMLELMAGGVTKEAEENYKVAVSSSQFLLIVVNDILVREWRIIFCRILRS